MKIIRFFFQKCQAEKYFGKGVQDDFKELVPPAQLKKAVARYYEKKVAVLLCMVFAGCILSLILFLKEKGKGEIITTEDYSYVVRNDAENGEKEISIVAQSGEKKEEIRLSIDPVRYTEEQFYEICKEIAEALPVEIVGENESLEAVSSSLNLPEHYGDYPVEIAWSMNDYTYIHTDGTVDTEALQDGESAFVTVTAEITYQDYLFCERFPIRLTAPDSKKESLEGLKEFMAKDQKEQSGQDKYILPAEYAGEALFFQNKKSNLGITFLILTFAASIILFFAQNRDLHKETEKRKEALMREYPEFVSKLMLFIGAGMTTKGAFGLLCTEYKKAADKMPKEKHYLYEELKLMTHAMENGVYETDAYEDFGRRCKAERYRRLMGLLSQNSKKGTKDILDLLEAESKETFELRKSEAKKMGERATTKLLLPMVLMLAIVMVIIIVPAFISYQI